VGREHTFHFCNKTHAIITLYEEKFYIGSWIQRFQNMDGGLCCFWACGEAAHHDRELKVKQSSPPGRNAKEKEEGQVSHHSQGNSQ
jgi:hypothetical protein